MLLVIGVVFGKTFLKSSEVEGDPVEQPEMLKDDPVLMQCLESPVEKPSFYSRVLPYLGSLQFAIRDLTGNDSWQFLTVMALHSRQMGPGYRRSRILSLADLGSHEALRPGQQSCFYKHSSND